MESVRKVTIMLTESCNLDCWMCDFGRRNGRTKMNPLDPEGLVALLSHPVWAKSLKAVTFTGGEPFSYPQVEELHELISAKLPALRVNFSSNATMLGKMKKVFGKVTNWETIGLLVSVDGVEKHDVQRGTKGAFALTVKNLKELRKLHPRLSITLKFTITPVNFDEIEATFRYFHAMGLGITAKLVENNPYYTNNLSYGLHEQDFVFTGEQIQAIGSQLESVLLDWPDFAGDRRRDEVLEALESLDTRWTRPDRCLTPVEGAFVDCDLNVFTCKEYPSVLNITKDGLESLGTSAMFREVVENERCNTGHCTRCTSQLKMPARKGAWKGLWASLTA